MHGKIGAVDLLVTDLQMPEQNGVDLTKELGDACPATVWYTASISNDEIADYTIQMQAFEGNNALALIEEHLQSQRSRSHPLSAIFVAKKDSPLLHLVNQIDSALLVRQESPNCIKNNATFLSFYQPKPCAHTLTEFQVHDILEELRTATRTIEGIYLELSELGLSKPNVENSLGILKKRTFGTIRKENSNVAFDDIHELLGEYQNLSPFSIETTISGSEHLLERWKEIFLKYRAIISPMGEKLRAYARGDIDLDQTIEQLAAKHSVSYYSSDRHIKEGRVPMLSDSDRLVYGLFDEALRIFKDVSVLAGVNAFADVSLRLLPESQRLSDSAEIKKISEHLEAGDLFQVKFSLAPNVDLGQKFNDIAGRIYRLREAKILYCNHQIDGDGFADFNFFIKAGGSKANLAEYVKKIEKMSAAPSLILKELNGFSDVCIYNFENVVCIGPLPCELDYHCVIKKREMAQGLIFKMGANYYHASGTSHKEAAADIHEYLRINGLLDDILTVDKIYEQGVRTTVAHNSGLKVEPEMSETNAAKKILLTLGMLESRIEIDATSFGKRKSSEDPESQLYKRHMQDLKKEKGNLISTSLGDIAETELAKQTIDSYLKIMAGAPIEEPSFIIRTTESLNLDQQVQLMDKFKTVLKGIGLEPYFIRQYDGFVQAEGSFARKSGIYFFDPDYEGGYREERNAPARPTNKLRPLISSSVSGRVSNDSLFQIAGQPLPKGTLIYGGGDHTISGCHDQIVISCALEILLQSLKVPYQVSRGEGRVLSSNFVFDGEILRKQTRLDGLFA